MEKGGCNISKTYLWFDLVLSDEQEGYGGQKQGLKHFNNPANHENRWSSNVVKLFLYILVRVDKKDIRSLWNLSFSLKIDRQTRLDPKPDFAGSLTSARHTARYTSRKV